MYIKFILFLSFISIFSSTHLFAMEEEDNVQSRLLKINIQPAKVQLVDLPHFEKSRLFLVSVQSEFKRNKTNYTYVSLYGDQTRTFSNSTGIAKYDPEISLFKSGESWDLQKGIDGMPGHIDYFYVDESLKLRCPGISWENCLVDVKGSLLCSTENMKLKKVYIWPIGNLTLKPSDEKCPLEKIRVVPANNQVPTLIDGHVTLNENPQVDLECINVSQVFFKFKQ